jgi:acylphosphatase
MDVRLHAVIAGSVQGVSFRWFALREAAGLGLRGWVRNRFDGRVEVLAEGERDRLEILLIRLRRGPLSARVKDVDVRWEEATGEYPDFRVESTV